jgi:hypothetical protein
MWMTAKSFLFAFTNNLVNYSFPSQLSVLYQPVRNFSRRSNRPPVWNRGRNALDLSTWHLVEQYWLGRNGVLRNMFLWHCIHHKSRTCWPGIEHGSRGERPATNRLRPDATPSVVDDHSVLGLVTMIMTNQHCFPSQKYYLQESQESGECFLLVDSYPTTLLLCHVFCSVQTRAMTTGARCTVLILDYAMYSLDSPDSDRNFCIFRNFVDLGTDPRGRVV